MVLATSRRAFLDAAMGGDRSAAAHVIDDLVAEGLGPAEVLVDLLAPVQVELGLCWEQGRCSVAEEHQVTTVTSAAVGALVFGHEPPPAGPRLVMVCAEGEIHDLPARIAAELFTLQGLRVTYLGTSVPARHLQVYLRDADVDVVGVSCTVAANLVGAARTISVARASGHPVITGGAAFGSTLRRARALGACGWLAQVPTEGVDLGAELWPDPADPPGRGPWSRLAAVRERVVERAMSGLLQEPAAARQACNGGALRDGLDTMARHVEAALLCDDTTVLTDHLDWLERRSRVNGVALLLRRHGLALLVDAIAGHVPDVAEHLGRRARPAH